MGISIAGGHELQPFRQSETNLQCIIVAVASFECGITWKLVIEIHEPSIGVDERILKLERRTNRTRLVAKTGITVKESFPQQRLRFHGRS